MQSVSQEALRAVQRRLGELADTADPGTLSRIADELFGAGAMFDANPVLRRSLADSAVPADARGELLHRLVDTKVGPDTVEVLETAARGRWANPVDLSDGIQQAAREALLAAADREGLLDAVEDELFRFGRILAREPSLQIALSDRTAAVDRRTSLLDQVLADRVSWPTRALLEQAVRAPRGRSMESTVAEISQLAAVRRDRYVAYVRTAVALTDEQERRLAAALGRVYGREMEIRAEVEPGLLGGIRVTVGDEVIDGTAVHRLDNARRALA